MTPAPAAPTPEQLAIAKRVGNRLSERLPAQGVMDWTDTQQFALEALLSLMADGEAPDEPTHLGAAIRQKTINLLREHGVLVRLGDGSYVQAEAPELDSLPPHIRDAIIADEETPSQRDPALGRGKLQGLSRSSSLAARGYRARKGVSGELTEREIEVLACVADGHSYEEAGSLLGIGRDTVSNHLARGRLALRARSTPHAVAIGFRRGLLS